LSVVDGWDISEPIMQLVKILWFNQNKNFGQGITEKGDIVFLPGTALIDTDGKFALEEGRSVFCELRNDNEQTYAFKIDPIVQNELFDKPVQSNDHIVTDLKNDIEPTV
jgi:cold shock CspA family protein